MLTFKFFGILCLAALSAFTQAQDFDATEEIILPGASNPATIAHTGSLNYTWAPLRWFGQASASGPNITIVGRDIADIAAHLRTLNPEFEAFNAEVVAEQPQGLARRGQLEKRDHTVCNNPAFFFAYESALRAAADRVYRIGGWCTVDGGRTSCNVLTCGGFAAVALCNDSNRGVTHQYMYCTDAALLSIASIAICGINNEGSGGNAQYFVHQYEYSILSTGAICA